MQHRHQPPLRTLSSSPRSQSRDLIKSDTTSEEQQQKQQQQKQQQQQQQRESTTAATFSHLRRRADTQLGHLRQQLDVLEAKSKKAGSTDSKEL
ncbi:MAG: hypothetical protein MHM6MM_008465 [Cercozoa sp. M6MM]